MSGGDTGDGRDGQPAVHNRNAVPGRDHLAGFRKSFGRRDNALVDVGTQAFEIAVNGDGKVNAHCYRADIEFFLLHHPQSRENFFVTRHVFKVPKNVLGEKEVGETRSMTKAARQSWFRTNELHVRHVERT